MELLRPYIQTILTVLLLAVVVDLLAPRTTEKYVRLVVGLVMVLAILGPVTDFLGQDPERILERWQVPLISEGTRLPESFSTEILWERALAASIRGLVHRTLVDHHPDREWEIRARVGGVMKEGQMRPREIEVEIVCHEDPGSISISSAPSATEVPEEFLELEEELKRRLSMESGLDPSEIRISWLRGR